MFGIGRRGIGHRSIATKLAIWVVVCTVASFALVLTCSQIWMRERLLLHLEDEMAQLRQLVGGEVEGALASVARKARMLARMVEVADLERHELHHLLLAVLADDERLHGVRAAFEPYGFSTNAERVDVHYYRRAGVSIHHADPAASDRYWTRPWYTEPATTRASFWSEPYLSRSAEAVPLITHSMPIFREDPGGRIRVIGVIAVDLRLRWLQDHFARLPSDRAGFGMVLSSTGHVVVHPDEQALMQDVRQSVTGDSERTMFEQVLQGHNGRVEYVDPDSGTPYIALFGPLGETGFTLVLATPYPIRQDEPILLSNRLIAVQLLGLVLLALATVWLTRRLMRPLQLLNVAARQIASGDLHSPLPSIDRRDETGHLAASFAHMRDALKEHIERLRTSTARQQRLDSELAIASQIQRSMLPGAQHHRYGPAASARAEVAGTLIPAKTVSGDFYDHFMLDARRVLVVVGDVSDKGIPAALFMSRTMTLFRAIAKQVHNPAVILTYLNRELCFSNEACMFVTLFCAVLELDSGQLRCANGGHEPVLLLKHDGAVRLELIEGGSALGVDEAARYTCWRGRLSVGDGLLIYTDGVTEAFNADNEAFGAERLKQVALEDWRSSGTDRTLVLRELVDGILQRVRTFAAGAGLSDDLTMLALRYERDDDAAAAPSGSADRTQRR